jgi:hypothetical protein
MLRPLRPPELLETIPERREPGLRVRVALSISHQHANAPHPLGLLRTPRAAMPPRTEQHDELTSITPLACVSGGPDACAVGGAFRRKGPAAPNKRAPPEPRTTCRRAPRNGTRSPDGPANAQPALLCIIAATSGMLAWGLDRPLTAAAFAAAATFMEQ